MTLTPSNVLIGFTSDSGERLQVSGSSRFAGNMVITGSGATSGTNGLLVQNSSAVSTFIVRNDGMIANGSTFYLYRYVAGGTAMVISSGGGHNNSTGISVTSGVGIKAYSDVGVSSSNLLGASIYAAGGSNYGNFSLGLLSNRALITSTASGMNMHTSSMLQVDSTDQGFLPPRMTAAQRTAITTPAQGLLVYDTDSATEGLWMYNGGSIPGWQEVLTNSGSQSISGSITADSITVTGTLTAQTIVAQTITSSILYSSGSNIFGNSLSNTQDFTGSLRVTGSSHYILGSVGINTSTPAYSLDINGTMRIANGGNGFTFSSNTIRPLVAGFLAIPTDYHFSFVNSAANSTFLRINGGGNVLINQTSDDGVSKLQVSGPAKITGTLTAQTTGSSIAGFITTAGTYNGSSVYSLKPVGLGMSTNASSNTGAIRIKMPTGTNTTMVKYIIDVYYYPGYGASYEIGGYDNGGWAGAFAYVTSGASYYASSVRLGYDSSGSALVFIGETTTNWGTYSPSVVIREIQAVGWNGNQNNLANYRNTANYNFSVVTSFTGDTISATIANPTLGVRFTGVGGLSSGSLLFGSTGGVIAQDNTNLFWDDANNRLGIGTNTPGHQLSVANSIRTGTHYVHTDGCLTCANYFSISHNNSYAILQTHGSSGTRDIILNPIGNVGIGTTSPSFRLDVSGSSRFTGNMVVTGNGATSATNALTILNSAGTGSLIVRNDGQVQVRSTSAGAPGYSFIDNTDTGLFMIAGGMYTTVDSSIAVTYRNNGIVFNAAADTTNSITSANLQLTKTGVGHRLSIWLNASNDFHFEAWENGVGYANNIILNGLYGNVIIGTTSNSGEKLQVSGSAKITNGLSVTGSITANDITVTGTLTAQTIVAQTITSSILYSSGSNIFGNSLSNTQQFTGSTSITGSLRVNGGIGVNRDASGGRALDIAGGGIRLAGLIAGNFEVNGNNSSFNVSTVGGIAGVSIADTSNAIISMTGNSYNYLIYANASSIKVRDVTAGSVDRFIIHNTGNVTIGATTDTGERLQVSGSSKFVGNMVITGSAKITQALTSSAALISGSGTQRLTVVGSGSAQPLFTVQGSQGELFSIVDSLSGSLFSVNDQSGLPIMEVFSDNTILMGNYLDPMLLTTTRTGSAAGINTLYTLPTSSYDAVYIDYTIRSGSNARAGNFMAMWSGTSVNFTDNSITEFGTTSGFVFGAHVSGSNMVVTGSSPTSGWTVKTIIKAI
jgi:hypothetical protein